MFFNMFFRLSERSDYINQACVIYEIYLYILCLFDLIKIVCYHMDTKSERDI